MEKRKGRLIICSKCGYAGYTLVKKEDGAYQHQTSKMCLKARLEAQGGAE